MTFPNLRSRVGLATVAAFSIAATGAGAATMHRFAVTQGTGSLGATSFTQTSTTSSALQGEVAASTNTSIRIPFGVLGEFNNGTNFGIGVAGISTTGYAVGAEAFGSSPALLALSSGTASNSGSGLEADTYSNDPSASGVLAQNLGAGAALTATSTNGDGVDANVTTDEAFAVRALDSSPDGAIASFGESTAAGVGSVGASIGGIGTLALSNAGQTGSPALGLASTAPGTDLLESLVAGTDGNEYQSSSITYPSANTSGNVLNSVGASSDFTLNGDVLITGDVYSGCTNYPATDPSDDCSGGLQTAARTSNGSMVRGYSATHASATMEDEGEAQLSNGYAHVNLDPTFASAISTRTPYLVFTTPQGDGPGLFVTRRTATGFDVRQSLGGHSSMTFDYRIVAHPYGSNAARMTVIRKNASAHPRMLSKKTQTRFATIEKMLKQRHAVKPVKPHSLVAMRDR